MKQIKIKNIEIVPTGGKTIKYDAKGSYKSNYSSWDSYYTLTSDTIGAYTIQYNYLDVLEFTNVVQEISTEAFQSRTTIKEVIFPKTMRKIGDRAFKGCSNISAVTMPTTVTTLGDSVFENCTKLTTINIPTNITKLPSQIFYGCSALERVDLPQSVTTLGGLCFYMSKVGNIDEILTNITTIEEAALGNLKNPNVTSITIPNNVTTIGSKLFNYNTYLQSVTLPATLTAYTSTMFGNCSALTSITLLGSGEPANVHADMFKNLTTQGTLHLPDAYASDFETVVSLLPEGWTVDAIPITYPQGVSVNNGVMTIDSSVSGDDIKDESIDLTGVNEIIVENNGMVLPVQIMDSTFINLPSNLAVKTYLDEGARDSDQDHYHYWSQIIPTTVTHYVWYNNQWVTESIWLLSLSQGGGGGGSNPGDGSDAD